MQWNKDHEKFQEISYFKLLHICHMCCVLTFTSLMHLWNVTDVHKYIQPYKKGFEWGDVTLSLSIWHLSFSFASLSTPLSLYFKVQIMHTALFKIKGAHQGGAGGGVHLYFHFLCPSPCPTSQICPENWIAVPINSSKASGNFCLPQNVLPHRPIVHPHFLVPVGALVYNVTWTTYKRKIFIWDT